MVHGMYHKLQLPNYLYVMPRRLANAIAEVRAGAGV